VHDDASTDNTANIIKEYEEKYPDIIKPIYQTVNQYSQKIPIGDTFQFPRAKGKYIAVCEGDDFWTDPYKLQKQYDALESHPEIDMCAHTASRINALTKEETGIIQPSKEDTILTAEQVIMGSGGYVATNSLMYRRELMDNLPPFRQFLKLDYTLQILGSLRGGMLFLKDNMSSYRVLAKGSWTSRMSKDNDRFVKHTDKLCNMLKILNVDTNYVYDSIINERILLFEFEKVQRLNEYKKMLDKKFKKFLKKYPLKYRVKIRLKAYFPFLEKTRNK
jgi:glycosyltransferase involved in cell wall biosynthesis